MDLAPRGLKPCRTHMPQVLEGTSLFLGYHGAALAFTMFLPRGAYLLELMPKGSGHAPTNHVRVRGAACAASGLACTCGAAAGTWCVHTCKGP